MYDYNYFLTLSQYIQNQMSKTTTTNKIEKNKIKTSQIVVCEVNFN